MFGVIIMLRSSIAGCESFVSKISDAIPHLAIFQRGYSVASTELDVKQRTDAERRAVVKAWGVSGETAEAFCRRHGISRESLKRWRQLARGEAAASHSCP